MNTKFVSVIMPTYKTPENYLKQAIDSILKQTYNNYELIIIDDGSEDNTLQIIEKYKDKRIKLYQNKKNMGLPFTLNSAIEKSNGTYIFRMDSDDISLPNRLEYMVNFMENNKYIDIAGSYFKEFGIRNRIIRLETTNDRIRALMLYQSPMCHPSVVFRRSSLIQYDVKYSYENTAEDYNLWIRCSLNPHIVFGNLNKVLLKYRTHDKQITIKDKKKLEDNFMKNHQIFLDYLHIKILDEFKDIYMHFCLRTGVLETNDFYKINQLLEDILYANQKVGLFNDQVLKNILSDKYRKEYLVRKYLYRQNCTSAYKNFTLKKYTSFLPFKIF